MTKRIAWLDEQFKTDDALLESRHREGIESASPYYRSDDLIINCKNGVVDTAENAPADSIVHSGKGIRHLLKPHVSTEKFPMHISIRRTICPI